MYSFSYVHKKIFAKNGAGSIPIVMLISCVSNELPRIKLQFCIRRFKEIFNALLLKATLSLDFFLMYLCYIIFGNKTRSISTFKNKIILLNLLINVSWGSLVYKVLKSCVVIDMVFFLFMVYYFQWQDQDCIVPRIWNQRGN